MIKQALLGAGLLLVAASPAFSQASALANCKYYTKVQQDFEQGLPYCQQAVIENPEDPEARFVAAWCMAEMGMLEEAWESFHWLLDRKDSKDKNVKKYAKNARVKVDGYYARYFNKGVELLNAGDMQGARDAFKWATTIDPEKTSAYLNLGYTQVQLGDLDGAMGSFDTCIQVKPDDMVSRNYYWDALGRKLAELRGADPVDEAAIADVSARLRETLEKILELEPNGAGAADAHLQLGDLDLAEGNKEAGLAHLRQAIDLDVEAVVNLVNIGIEFYANDDYEAAVDAFTIVLEYVDDPEDEIWTKAMWVMGLSYFEMERFEPALAQFEKLLEIDPDNMDYLPKAGLSARKAGKQDEGDRYLIRWEELKEEQITGASVE